MEKILIVEDSKIFLNVLEERVKLNNVYIPFLANSFDEAVKLIDNNNFFVAVVDLVLSDAMNGEIVDYVISKNIPTIALTGSLNNKLKEEIMKKNIIDYISKGTDKDDINYSIFLAEKLLFFKGKKALIIDDSKFDSCLMRDYLLSLMFNVNIVGDANIAMEFLEKNQDTKLILLDYDMPGMTGLQLIRVIRNKYNENIGIIAVTGKHSNELQYGFLKYGADDYITKPFTKDRFNAIIVNNFRRIQQLDQIKSYVRLVEEMSITDHLTRCYNRFYLDSTLEVYIEKYVRYNRPFSILIIDIDHFKLVNDTFGHQAGDKVLIQFVNLIKTNIRKIDILGRWGGEEFLIICPETNLSDTVKLAEKLVKCIENGVFDNNLKITCSIGVAEYKMNEVRESVVKRADDALYIAKDSGRNKVAYL